MTRRPDKSSNRIKRRPFMADLFVAPRHGIGGAGAWQPDLGLLRRRGSSRIPLFLGAWAWRCRRRSVSPCRSRAGACCASRAMAKSSWESARLPWWPTRRRTIWQFWSSTTRVSGETGRQRGLTSNRAAYCRRCQGLWPASDTNHHRTGRGRRARGLPVQSLRAGAGGRQDRHHRRSLAATGEGSAPPSPIAFAPRLGSSKAEATATREPYRTR